MRLRKGEDAEFSAIESILSYRPVPGASNPRPRLGVALHFYPGFRDFSLLADGSEQ